MNKKITALFLVLVMSLGLLAVSPGGVQSEAALKIGDYILFGTYYEDPILWRVIDIDKDGDPMLLSDKILCLKPFDVPGPYHSGNQDRSVFGSNYWQGSNLRQWLNSSEKTIKWIQNPPVWKGMDGEGMSYEKEKGFLADGNFTGQERGIMKPVTHKAVLDLMDREEGGEYYENVSDTVFLLSKEELKSCVEDRGWEYRAKPSKAAVTKGEIQSPFEEDLLAQAEYHFYWLRDPGVLNGYEVSYIGKRKEEDIRGTYARNWWFGVRPALYVKQGAAGIKSGAGTEGSPYIFTVSGFTDTAGAKAEQAKAVPAELLAAIDAAVPTNIAPQFAKARDFSDGLAAVQQGDKWGFIDRAGRMVVKPQYEGANDFREGLAPVKQGGKWGFIDKAGNMVIRPQFVYATSFWNGFAGIFDIDISTLTSFSGNAIYQIDKEGNHLPSSTGRMHDVKEGLKAIYEGGLWGFTDEKGNKVIASQYQDVQDFTEGLAAVERDDRWGFIDRTGKEIIAPEYTFAVSFSEGLAVVQKEDGWMTFIDKAGNKVIDKDYRRAYSFDGGLAVVAILSKPDEKGYSTEEFGVIDKNGNQVVEFKYKKIIRYGDSLFEVYTGDRGELFGYMDKNGKELLPPRYNQSSPADSQEGIILFYSTGDGVPNKNLKGLFSLKYGKLLAEPIYEKTRGFYSEGMMPVSRDKKWGYVDRSGKEVIKPQYSGVNDFNEGLATVWDKGGLKVIDKTGKVLLSKPQYTEGGVFFKGFVMVKNKSGKWGIMDKTGKEIIKPRYFDIEYYEAYGLFSVNAGDASNCKYGLVDKKDREVVKPQYDDMDDVEANGLSMVEKGATETSEGKYGFIDRTGKEVVKPVYDYIAPYIQEGMRLVQLNGKYGFVTEFPVTAAPAAK